MATPYVLQAYKTKPTGSWGTVGKTTYPTRSEAGTALNAVRATGTTKPHRIGRARVEK